MGPVKASCIGQEYIDLAEKSQIKLIFSCEKQSVTASTCHVH
jgi:hypothetical protein